VRQNEERRKRNSAIKSRLTTETRKFERALEHEDAEEAREQLSVLTKLLHRAAKKNVLHENTAARRQSKLQRQLNQIAPPGQ
jgi:small subunit ribosomal protein S20